MKKIFLSIAAVLVGQSAMANVLIESVISPVNPVEGDQTKFVRVLSHGEVQRLACDSITKICDVSSVATLSPYAINHIYGLIAQARVGFMVDVLPTCTDPAYSTHTYTADNGTVRLETATYPCGVVSTNNTDGADALLGIVKQYEF